MSTSTTISAFKFSSTATSDQPNILQNKSAEQFIKEKYQNQFNFGTNNLIKTGFYKIMGWRFDFRPFLKKFLYKQYGQWTEIYAPNKTAVRTVTYGRIDKIVELK